MFNWNQYKLRFRNVHYDKNDLEFVNYALNDLLDNFINSKHFELVTVAYFYNPTMLSHKACICGADSTAIQHSYYYFLLYYQLRYGEGVYNV